MRVAVFENLANSAYVQAKMLNRLGVRADLILDPLDRYVMSDPRWEDLDIELPTDQLVQPPLPDCELPDWVRFSPETSTNEHRGRADRVTSSARKIRTAMGLGRAARLAATHAGWRGLGMAADRAWVLRTLSEYDCVIAYGAGPAWAALARVPCIAETWGGDITMVPFYDTGDWEGHESTKLPGPRGELFALAKLQRLGYAHAGRILLTDPRFQPYVERLGHIRKSLHMGFFIDVDKYRPQAEVELREQLLKGADGPIVFVPSRQDWYWKGSDRLLRGFAQVAKEHPTAILVCAGWGSDLDRSRRLITDLGIGEQVRLLPCAMSKVRLRRYYCAADIVADQFTVGSYGGSSLEAMSCARPLLISLERDRFARRFSSFPPVMNVTAPEEIGGALMSLLNNPQQRTTLGNEAREWVIANHGPSVAERVIELCHEVVGENTAHRSVLTR